MAVITLPDSLKPSRFTWGQQRRDLDFASLFGSQSVEVSGPKWMVSLAVPLQRDENAGAWQALQLKLAGKTNPLELWNIGRPVPLGTMRGTMTLSGAHAQGASALTIVAAGEVAKTLKAGDLLGFGSGLTQHVVMVTDDALSNASAIIAVNINPGLRSAFASGTAVTWYRPKALFRSVSSRVDWEYSPGKVVKIGELSLVEDWRA